MGHMADVQTALKDWRNWFNGWGMVLLPGDVGGDRDDCVVAGQLDNIATHIANLMTGRAYLEISVSGTGIHFIALVHFQCTL
jgi:primase-polymerase (primpol)-like protein